MATLAGAGWKIRSGLAGIAGAVLLTAVTTAGQQLGTPQQPGRPAPAQAPARDSSATAATGIIRGRVIAADTGQPLRKVQVRLMGAELRGPLGAETDAQGRYEIREVPAGRFQVMTSKGGFVSLQYGQQRPFEAGRPIDIARGATLERIDFAMPRASVITGTIVDEAGEPVMDVQVSAMRYQFVQGQRRLVASGRIALTNDVGEFRIFALSPGQYYLSATLRDSLMTVSQTGVMPDGAASGTGYAPTYYPGTTSAAEAQRLTLGLGQTMAGVTMALSPTRTSRIYGSAIGSDGKASAAAMVMAIPKANASPMSAATGQTRPDGSFTIGGITPGAYTLMAILGVGVGSSFEMATADVTVEGADVRNVELIALKPVSVSGRVTFDAADGTTPPQTVSLTAVQTDLLASGIGSPNVPARVNDDRAFELKVSPGRNVVRLGGAAGLWAIRTVRYAGRDVTDEGFDARPGEDLTGLEVELTNRATTFTGTVTDAQNRPLNDYTVIAFSQDKSRWTTTSRHINVGRADQQGQFRVRIPAGSYHLIAVDYIEPGEQFDPELLEKLIPAASSLSITAAELKTVNLKLVNR